MKTKEFIKRVEELELDIEISEADVFIKYDGYIVARISRISIYVMRIYTGFNVKYAKELFDLCTEYAKTPIDEREEEEKFYLQKMKSFYDKVYDEEYAYLNVNINDDYFTLNNLIQNHFHKTQFTQKEIDEIKKKFNTDLSEFKQIPVEEIEAWN